MLRKLLTAAVLVVLLPLAATADECVNVEINHADGQTWAGAYTGDRDAAGIRTGVVGHYLWVQYGEEENRAEEDETVSTDVSDPSITGASVCPDGTVTLHHAVPVASPEVVDLVDTYPGTINPSHLVRPEGWTAGIYPV